MQHRIAGRFVPLAALIAVYLVVELVLRAVLHVAFGLPGDVPLWQFAVTAPGGFLNDVVQSLYLHAPLMLLVAFLPAVVAGTLFAGYVKRVLYTTPAVIAWSFIVGGIVMLIVERYRPEPVVANADHTSLLRALGIGACQVLALIPGVSRSGATIVGAMLLRLDRPAAAEFSFFLAMPTMTGAFVHDMLEARHSLGPERAEEIAIGFVMAFLASLLVVKPFLRFVGRSGFAPFAWYRIAAGAALALALAAGWL